MKFKPLFKWMGSRECSAVLAVDGLILVKCAKPATFVVIPESADQMLDDAYPDSCARPLCDDCKRKTDVQV